MHAESHQLWCSSRACPLVKAKRCRGKLIGGREALRPRHTSRPRVINTEAVQGQAIENWIANREDMSHAQRNHELRNYESNGSTASQGGHPRRQPGPRPILYGLPCLNCRLYYAAELAVCPTCDCGNRISPVTGLFPPASML